MVAPMALRAIGARAICMVPIVAIHIIRAAYLPQLLLVPLLHLRLQYRLLFLVRTQHYNPLLVLHII